VTIAAERFASYRELHLLAQRWTLTTDTAITVDIDAGIDAEIWSLNGTHLPQVALEANERAMIATGTTVASDIGVAVATASVVAGGTIESDTLADGEDRLVRRRRVAIAAGETVVIDTVAAVFSSSDVDDPEAAASATVAGAADYNALQTESQRQWATIWEDMDVAIEGNPVDQATLRFSAYHNRICTPAHSDHLPIGARGLSCQAYQGSAFWDQEVYNLPAFLFSEPELARSLLTYRHKTLDGARRKAARLGYDGAYFAWISGVTGDELCPDIFFKDVLTGRPIRNHFNVWQMHVAPDVVTTMARYVEVTGDTEFLLEHGAEVAFEVARFLRSFVRYNDWKKTYHCIRLLGPDEWHENVDDNAFTNYQAHAALSFAIDTYERFSTDLADVVDGISLLPDEVDAWRRVRDGLVLPAPDPETLLIEQFAGFFDLEDVLPDEVRDRLIDPTEYWGWPNGVAVATQVSKQADVAMLLWLQEEGFDNATARANYEYYEARCSHNSSLSHAAHGMVAIRIGLLDRAIDHFRATASVDLLNTNHPVVGGTFIGGIHTAACGGTYQLAVQGFGGLGFRDGALTINPALPADWESMSYPIRWRGSRFTVRVEPERISIASAAGNDRPTDLLVRGESLTVLPGATVIRETPDPPG
jgi:kojibiose phosphorylase